MNAKEFLAALKKNDISGAYLFLGPEAYLARQLADAAVQAVLPETLRDFNMIRLYGSELEPQSLSAQLASHPFMAERRIVHIPGFEGIPTGREEGILDALKQKAASTVLLIEAAQIDRRRKLGEWIISHCDIVDCPEFKDGEAAAWIQGQFAKRGIRIEAGVPQDLIRRAGTSLFMLAAEIEKLSLYADPDAQYISRSDCESLVPPQPEDQVFGLLDAIGARDLGASVRALQALFAAGQPETLILFVIARQFHQVYLAQYLHSQGAGAPEVGKALNLRYDFQIRRILEQARAFTEPELRAALRRLRDGDASVKTGAREPRVELEMILFDLCTPGRLG